MKRQALASKMTYGRPIPIERIVERIGDRAQTSTQVYTKRPYGVGLLVAGVVSGSKPLFRQLLLGIPGFEGNIDPALHSGRDGSTPVRISTQWYDARDGGVCNRREESNGENLPGATSG